MKTVLLIWLMALLAVSQVGAQIHYVDAGAENTPNNGWNYRTGYANGSDVYEGQDANALELTTTITG
ncbi:MAG: hypothetical protein KJO79_09005, partial [Verrucomicrobiae bacterium]|nr:hypothetical protein [Verrucomicrobiae bacterium]NNJ87308.1 hypothetical protein [Akkermansiaceae bacterium]